MKNLANCTPKEFMVQTNKIRKSVAKWLSLTRISEIRADVPEFDPKLTKEEWTKLRNEKAKENLGKILDAIMEEHPDETIELIALMSFVEPEDANNHPVSFYLQNLDELINDEVVLNFFTSLIRLVNKNTSIA